MAAKLFFHRYALRSKGALNAASARVEHPGALIFDGQGYACVHPWPELGDRPLDEVLGAIMAGDETLPMAMAARRCLAVDGEARAAGRSLYAGLKVPVSHFSWDAHQPTEDQIWQIDVGGFSAVKMKVGPRLERAQVEAIRALAQGDPQLRFRFDFNEVLPPNAVERAFAELAELTQGEIDFFEDPCAYDPELWADIQRRNGYALALDWGYQGEGEAMGADIVVWKPAGRPRPEHWPSAQPSVCVTSMMDHPLGQAYAAYEAGVLGEGRTTACGLATQSLFEPSPFSEALGAYPTSHWLPPEGNGLGFDPLLQSLEWKPLS